MNRKITSSYGLILFSVYKNVIYYVIAKRRNSIPYIYLVTGRAKEHEAIRYISYLPNEERKLLINHDYDTIFKDYYMSDHKKHLSVKHKIEEAFNNTVMRHKKLLNERSIIDCISWELPKGRRKMYESAVTCATREFIEETGINDFKVVINNPFVYQYTGYDGNTYRSTFYVAYTDKKIPIKYRYSEYLIGKRYVSEEMVDVEWATFRQCERLMDYRQKRIIQSINRIIRNKLSLA